jgi:hypothetical protein
MSVRQIYTLGDETRELVRRTLDTTPDGWRVELLRPRRTLAQNKALWPMLSDLSHQIIWYGQKLSPEEWKQVCVASLRKSKVVPTLDADGLVVLSLGTSTMSDEEMANLLELIKAFGTQQGVRWTAPRWMEEMAERQRTAKREKIR